MNQTLKDCTIFSFGLFAGAILALASVPALRRTANNGIKQGWNKVETSLTTAKETAAAVGEEITSYRDAARSALEAGNQSFRQTLAEKQTA